MNFRELSSREDIKIHENPQSIIFSRKKGFLVIGICEIGAGLNKVQHIIINSSPENIFDKRKIKATKAHLMEENNLRGDMAVISHDLEDELFVASEGPVTAVTFTPQHNKMNQVSPDLAMLPLNNEGSSYAPWFLNNIIFINEELDSKSLIKCFKAGVEAKERVLETKGVNLSLRKSIIDESSLLVASNYTNQGTTGEFNKVDFKEKVENPIQECMLKSCQSALNNANFSLGVLDYIYQSGISLDDLVEAGMELCVGLEVTSQLKEKLAAQILKSLSDINVIALIMAGLRVEEDFKMHRLREVEVEDDPAYLYSDEVLGMAIANQIAGTKAIFNFKRYDELKPGIISELGPMIDDIIAGLLAGCMSKIFEP